MASPKKSKRMKYDKTQESPEHCKKGKRAKPLPSSTVNLAHQMATCSSNSMTVLQVTDLHQVRGGGSLPLSVVAHGRQVQKERRGPGILVMFCFLIWVLTLSRCLFCENSSSPYVDALALFFLYVLLSPSQITLKNGKFNYDSSRISNLT